MISLKNFWYIAASSEEVTSDSVTGVVVLGEWIALYRDQQGKAVAVLDRCLHRNARLSKGRVKNGQLVCPYHGWRYGEDGKLQAIPSEGPAQAARGARCLPNYLTLEKDGYIYLQLEKPKPEIPALPEPFDIPYLGRPGYQHIRLKHLFRAEVPNCAENFIDIPHTTYVHPKIFRYEAAPQSISAEVEAKAGAVHVRYLNETSNFGLFSLFLNRRKTIIFHQDHYYLPNVTHVEYRFGDRRHFNITSQSIPVGPKETLVYTDLTYDYGFWNYFARPIVRWVARKIIAQDVKIMSEQTEVTERYGERFISTKADLQHVWIEKFYQSVKQGQDPRTLPEKKETVVFWI